MPTPQMVFALAISIAIATAASAQSDVATLSRTFLVRPNVTYVTAGGSDLKLDVISPNQTATPTPVALFFHGGGWRGVDPIQPSTKESNILRVLPYLSLGMTVVNVEYRTAKMALAPAEIEDARCAMGWVAARAKELNVDAMRMVIIGESTGGHLALMAGMAPIGSEFDIHCPGTITAAPKVIINWSGITDLEDITTGAHAETFSGIGQAARTWLGAGVSPERIRALSPVFNLRAGAPAIISIHGDKDQTVPIEQATRLHDALARASIPNRIVTLNGGGHGLQGAPPDELARALEVIRAFLVERGVLR